MCYYNQINGTFASENKWLLTDVLRGDWGFKGYVMSDWGAVNDRVKGLEAGLELEMPSSNGVNDALIVQAVKDGSLKEDILDQAVERILRIIFEYADNRAPVSYTHLLHIMSALQNCARNFLRFFHFYVHPALRQPRVNLSQLS